jgi:hypothetical protein
VVGGAFLKTAFAKSIRLGLEGAGTGVVDFRNVRQGRILPVRFFRMKESLEEFSASYWGRRIGEFFKRKQAPHGMREGWR